jgi:hypothetical protein
MLASFSFLNFGLYRSNTITNQQKDSYSANEPKVDISQTLHLYVVKGHPLSNSLEKELKKELQENTRDVKSFLNLKDNFDGPLVAVQILKNDLLYTPFYSQADVTIFVFFSASGNSTYFQKFVKAESEGDNVPVIFRSQETPNIIIKCKMKVTDTTYGVFSKDAYNTHIAEEISKQVNENMEEIITKY